MTQAATGIFAKKAESTKPDAGAKVPAGTHPELARLLGMTHIIKGASPAELVKIDALEAAIRRADAIVAIRDALTDDVMRRFYPLMNTSLGFRTDRPNKRNPKPYEVHEVRVCMVEALLMGLRLTDNEWNIISDRCYVTREGFTRLLKEHHGLTDLKISPGIPSGDPSRGVVIPYSCVWRLDGVEQTLTASIPVRGGEYSTIDQLLGKGDRKIKARIWAKVTGSEVSADGEVEIDVDPAGADASNPGADRLAALKQTKKPDAGTQPPPEAAGAKAPTANANGDHGGPGGHEKEPPAHASGAADAEPPPGWKPGEPTKAKPGEVPAPWET